MGDKTRQYLSVEDQEADMMHASPRQRISFNRASPLTLDGTWQTLPLGNNSAFDINSFPINRFNTSTNTILANPDTDFEQGYLLELDIAIKPNASGTIIKPMVRFMVPRPVEAGGPYYFPLPDSLKRMDLGYEITGTTEVAMRFTYPVYTSALIRQYGARIQINYTPQQQSANLLTGLLTAVSNILTGTQRPQITDATLNMYSLF